MEKQSSVAPLGRRAQSAPPLPRQTVQALRQPVVVPPLKRSKNSDPASAPKTDSPATRPTQPAKPIVVPLRKQAAQPAQLEPAPPDSPASGPTQPAKPIVLPPRKQAAQPVQLEPAPPAKPPPPHLLAVQAPPPKSKPPPRKQGQPGTPVNRVEGQGSQPATSTTGAQRGQPSSEAGNSRLPRETAISILRQLLDYFGRRCRRLCKQRRRSAGFE